METPSVIFLCRAAQGAIPHFMRQSIAVEAVEGWLKGTEKAKQCVDELWAVKNAVTGPLNTNDPSIALDLGDFLNANTASMDVKNEAG